MSEQISTITDLHTFDISALFSVTARREKFMNSSDDIYSL